MLLLALSPTYKKIAEMNRAIPMGHDVRVATLEIFFCHPELLLRRILHFHLSLASPTKAALG